MKVNDEFEKTWKEETVVF